MLALEKTDNRKVKTLRNLIGGNHILTAELGALSLIRKFGADHAYLILEMLADGKRKIFDAHLVINKETEELPHKKGQLIFREIPLTTTTDEMGKQTKGLVEVAHQCHSITWSVDRDKINRFFELIEKEKMRTEKGEINYITAGNAKAAGLFGASLQTSKSEAIGEWSLQKSVGTSLISAGEYLLLSGHNCYSWAHAMVMNLELRPPKEWAKCIVRDPRLTIKGNQSGDAFDHEPSTNAPRCQLM